jgi:glycosyltransferase involved in cell wall biosynthesis
MVKSNGIIVNFYIMAQELVSIIIRTKNEEKWIASCLNAIFNQDYKNFEVIVVDNYSADKTIEKLKNYKVKLLKEEKYMPGKLLNMGIKESKGKFIACLSGHCIPVNNKWLSNLIKNFDDPLVAGVYGRQEPLSFTPAQDKRDLVNIFRLERIVQTRDSFFHNANSMIRRSVWEETPFDETVTNIEDRVWGKAVIDRKLKIIYEPEASVYHYHGVHQTGDEVRCFNVVKILEDMDIMKKKKDVISPKDLKVIALVPIKKQLSLQCTRKLIHYTMRELKKSAYIDGIYVITDDKGIAHEAEKECATIPFLRPKELSPNHVNLSDVFRYAIEKLEEKNIYADLVVMANITYPFRPGRLFDTLLEETIVSGMDTVVAAYPEFRVSWKSNDKKLTQLNDFRPRIFKEPVQIGMVGLGCVTHPFKIRENEILSGKVGIYEVPKQLSSFEVRTESDYNIFSVLVKQWFSDKGKRTK